MKITIKIHPHSDAEIEQCVKALSCLSFPIKDSAVPAEKTDTRKNKDKDKKQEKPVAEPPKQEKPEPPKQTEPPKQPEPPKTEKPVAEGEEKPKATTPEGQVITKELLLEFVGGKIQAGFREEVRKELDALGAKNVSGVKESDYQTLYDALSKLK